MDLTQLTFENLVNGTIILSLLGGLLATFAVKLTKVPSIIFAWLRRWLVVELQIRNFDASYPWILAFLSSKVQSNILAANTEIKEDSDPTLSKVHNTIGFGWHWLKYKHKYIWLHRESADLSSNAGSVTKGLPEQLSMYCFIWNKKLLVTILADARAEYIKRDSDSIMTYTHNSWGWFVNKPIKKRVSGACYPDRIFASLLTDIYLFLTTESRYRSLGVPYRRGYLFYGCPGSGKTTLITALASALDLDIYLLNPSIRYMDDKQLLLLLNMIPAGSIIALEDVDALSFINRNTDDEEQITFRGFLNAIDGIGAYEGKILIMTTNHKDKLDPALLREGRIDMEIELNMATNDQLFHLFKHFYPEKSNESAIKFANKYNNNITMARAQKILFSHTAELKDY